TVRQFDDLIKRLIGSAKRQDQRQQAAARPAPEWKPVHSSARRSGMHVRPASDKEDMIRKIEAILTELRLPWSYADRMAKRMFGIDALRFCDPGQTYKLLQALCVYQKRKGGPAI
ncbi:MAG: phage protein GemA/Gp16 family protein, partial [Syntrophobacteraceae bacterium]